jgi:hypothetical protein
MRRLTLASFAFLFGTLAACKSGLDERCQVTADCESGLVCVVLSANPENPVSVCREGLEDQSDAAIDAPQDGPETDAAPAVDATPDAATDAAVDATPDA